MADAMHLGGALRVHHTTGAMEVLPADSSTLVICERRRAWRVIGDSRAATARHAGHGVCSCVGVCVHVVSTLFDLREKSQLQKEISLKSIVIGTRQFLSLKSVLSLK